MALCGAAPCMLPLRLRCSCSLRQRSASGRGVQRLSRAFLPSATRGLHLALRGAAGPRGGFDVAACCALSAGRCAGVGCCHGVTRPRNGYEAAERVHQVAGAACAGAGAEGGVWHAPCFWLCSGLTRARRPLRPRRRFTSAAARTSRTPAARYSGRCADTPPRRGAGRAFRERSNTTRFVLLPTGLYFLRSCTSLRCRP